MSNELMTTRLDEGQATLHLPSELTKDSLDDFEYWINGILKRLRRRVQEVGKVSDDETVETSGYEWSGK